MTVKEKLKQEIDELSEDTAEEVFYFVKFIETEKEKKMFNRIAQKTSEPSFIKIWDNPEDAAYDKL